MHVFHVITGLNDGGAEAVLYRICRHDLMNCHCVVSLMDSGKYGPLLEKAGVDVYTLGMPRGRVTFSGLLLLFHLLRDKAPDVVQTWMYHADFIGGLLARLSGASQVFWGIHHSSLEPGKSHRITMVVARVNAWLSRWVPTGIICCAESARAVHGLLGYEWQKMVVVPNGYDLTCFRPDVQQRLQLRAEWGVDLSTPLIGMVGRFDPLKDHENLFRALSSLVQRGERFRCVLVGLGLEPTNGGVVLLLNRYGLQNHISLLGQRSDIPGVMNALDIHVLSSNSEAFPNVLAEAMACGTPCITTDVGDAALIVGDTGWVVPSRDSELLTDALESAIAGLQDRNVWGHRQRTARQRIIERFSIDHMITLYHEAWRRNAIPSEL